MSTTSSSQWNITTDIYDIVDSVNNLKANIIEDEDETTLALGIFGFIGDTESKKIQSSILMTGELGNEMFPTRAKLDRNIITHAIYCNVDNINATPASMSIRFGVKEDDLSGSYFSSSNQFTFACTNAIYVEDYEFHFDYDIILKRTPHTDTAGNVTYTYSASYDMDEKNPISSITNQYLDQPTIVNFNNYRYVFITATVHQVSIEETTDKLITASIIDNKSFTFTFNNQLANFEVYFTETVDNIETTTKLTPYFYGSTVDQGVDNYCWYLYMNDDTIRISFDQNSKIPGLNADIRIVAYTTVGATGNFTYTDTDEGSLYCDFSTDTTKTITCFVQCLTDSENGVDKKSSDELKKLIPKMAMSRGYITTETDLNNYFNLIANDTNIMKLQKKVDNQLNRVWYCYLLLKTDVGNVIPTNTLPIKVNLTDTNADTGKAFVVKCADEDGRYLIKSGTCFKYDPTLGYAVPIAESTIPISDYDTLMSTNATDNAAVIAYNTTYYGASVYYYKCIYSIVLNTDPLYCAYYLNVVNSNGYFEYSFANDNMDFGFIATTNTFVRSLITDTTTYKFNFDIVQSVNENKGLITVTDNGDGTSTINKNNMKVFLVLYKNGDPYRYTECTINSYDETTYSSSWQAKVYTDDGFNSNNELKLLANDPDGNASLFEVGFNSSNYGYFDPNTEAYIYIAGKFDKVYADTDLKLQTIVPGLEDYSLINIYKVNNGIDFFTNFTNITNTRVRVNTSETNTVTAYDISGVPMIGYHYYYGDQDTAEANSEYLISQILEKKAYIDYCLTLIENNMDIDFKFYNTYGYSYTYNCGDTAATGLGHIDISLKFRAKIINSSDVSTKTNLIAYIKSYVEDLDETGDLDFPNLIHDAKEKFSDKISWIEFINYNGNSESLQHIALDDVVDAHTVPEFINVRNNVSSDGETLTPAIDVEIII